MVERFSPAEPPGLFAKLRGAAGRLVELSFGGLSLVVLLAILATVPVLQLVALGYLLRAAERYVASGKLGEAFIGVREAGRIGQFLLGLWLVSLLPRLLISLHEDALLVDPRAPVVSALRIATLVGYALVGFVALVALSQGGGLVHFFRPLRATRRLVADLRAPHYPSRQRERLLGVAEALGLPAIFRIGLLGYLGALLWLALPTTIVAFSKRGGGALLGGLLLALVVVPLPFLQLHYVVEDRFRAFVEVRQVAALSRRAPLAFAVALTSTLLLAIPLYVLEIELVPREAAWLPAAVFVFTVFPTKLLTAWAYRRALARPSDAPRPLRWLARPWMLAVALVYAVLVFLTQYTGWHGALGLYAHHAFLLPLPF
ncbi:MAG: hypothetical protein KC731_06625 [Myxococcales bacterium]|nr:hypothetical protein [Myxococcales bacterium]